MQIISFHTSFKSFFKQQNRNAQKHVIYMGPLRDIKIKQIYVLENILNKHNFGIIFGLSWHLTYQNLALSAMN